MDPDARWPTASYLCSRLTLPAGVVLDQLARAEIPALCDALRAAHPDIAIGEEQHLLSPALYEEEAALQGEADAVAERALYVVVLRAAPMPDDPDAAPALIGAAVLERGEHDHSLMERMSVVDPRWRGRGLGRALLRVAAIVGQAIDADLLVGLVELDHLTQCALLESEGWRLCGLVPESERRQVAPGVTRFVPEAIYAKILAPPPTLLWPRPADVTPRVAALLELLAFPQGPAELAPAPPPPQRAAPAAGALTLDPALAARLQQRPGGAATWPDIQALAQQIALPAGFTVTPLRQADLPLLLAQLPAWFPELAQGSLAHLLDGEHYRSAVALEGEDQTIARRPSIAWVIRRGEELAALCCCSYDIPGYTLRGELAVVAPRYRRSGLTQSQLPLAVLVARAIEAETVMSWATLRHLGAQRICEDAGWQLWGVIPASERYASAGGAGRGAEALYGLSLIPPQQARWPDPAGLPPRHAALLRQLGVGAVGA